VRLAPASTENDERLLLVMVETINDELQICQIEIAQKLKNKNSPAGERGLVRSPDSHQLWCA
jgi:hypothetical protein